MKSVVYSKYGPPEVLQLKELDEPIPNDDEVRIKVHTTTVTATDCVFRKGEPRFSRLFTGITRPKKQVLGSEFAGEIDAIGKAVKHFKTGEKVFGTTPGNGSYAEYICLPESSATLTRMPASKSYEEAISCCDGFLTALPFLRDKGKIKKGDKVLIIGASGSVGSAAVQLAKYFGAEVTGVCSTSSIELVKSIGADKLIDYAREDFTDSGEMYDIIFDAVGKAEYSKFKKFLKPGGKFLEVGITLKIFPYVISTSILGQKKVMIMATGLRPPSERTKDLNFVKELVEKGDIKPLIDRIFPLEKISEAHAYVDKGHKKGNVLIKIEHNDK